MRLLCIDPGTTESGVVIYDGWEISFKSSGIDNEEILTLFQGSKTFDCLAIEMVASYGMAVGKTVFETCVWIGRFIQGLGVEYTPIYRKDVKLCLCGSYRAKDANIRQAILDKFPATGGGKTPQVGTKKEPGPLYGVSKHAWAALAVGLTWFENYGCEK
jgi:hypothetical protein